ncbi:MAG: response regulator [Bacteroidales bacterium]|nr:response regulator [Bacteroidales bacterium]
MEKSKKVLIVDDDIDVINIVQTILENEGFQVIIAGGKDEAIEKAKVENPDLAICDVMMSTHFEGFELAKEFMTKDEFKNMPVLIQTSINVFSSPDEDAMRFARNYRSEMNDHDLDVLLVENLKTGKAGIDYKNEQGEIVWLPVDGFISKPVNAKKLIEAINRVL